jgi:hyperosmotically inducible protein
MKKLNTTLAQSLMATALLTGVGAASAASLSASIDAATQSVLDSAVTGKVKAKLAADSRLNGSDISVTTENDVLILTGKAPTPEAKAAAEDIAKASVDADVHIVNRIDAPSVMASKTAEVKADVKATAQDAGEVITDSWITTKVKSQLLADTATKGTAMSVTTKDNVVILKGTVRSQAEKDQAVAIAQQTRGVAKVNASQLKVSTKVKAGASISSP